MSSFRRRADDELFRVHSRYLGPPDFTLPFALPYRSILPGLGAGSAVLVLLSLFGVGAWKFLIAAAACAGAGALAARFGGADRPVSALPAVIASESGAPRPVDQQPSRAVLSPTRVPVYDPRSPKENDQP